MTKQGKDSKGSVVILPIRIGRKGGKVHRALRRAARLSGLPLSTYVREAAVADALLRNVRAITPTVEPSPADTPDRAA